MVTERTVEMRKETKKGHMMNEGRWTVDSGRNGGRRGKGNKEGQKWRNGTERRKWRKEEGRKE